jgi:hypothetical protein
MQDSLHCKKIVIFARFVLTPILASVNLNAFDSASSLFRPRCFASCEQRGFFTEVRRFFSLEVVLTNLFAGVCNALSYPHPLSRGPTAGKGYNGYADSSAAVDQPPDLFL